MVRRLCTMTVLMALSLMLWGPFAHATSQEGDQTRSDVPKLTQEQKAELDGIRQSILQNQIQLVDKYVEFGILTREKGDALISDLKNREEKWKKEQMKSTDQEKSKKENSKSPNGAKSKESQTKSDSKNQKNKKK